MNLVLRYAIAILHTFFKNDLFVQIPDEHAEKLVTPGSIAKYVVDHQNM